MPLVRSSVRSPGVAAARVNSVRYHQGFTNRVPLASGTCTVRRLSLWNTSLQTPFSSSPAITVARPFTGYQPWVEKPAEEILAPPCCALSLDWIRHCATAAVAPAPPSTRVGA